MAATPAGTPGPSPSGLAPGAALVVRRGWQRARVVGLWDETPVVRAFRLALPQWSPHLPGQHAVVRLTAPDGYRAQRSYSIASPPEQEGVIDLAVERLPGGEVSGFLHDGVAVGDELEVRTPLGGWFTWTGEQPALAVGGGSGVVPLVSMLRSHHRRTARGEAVAPLHLVVSARSAADLPFADELLGDDDATVVLTRSAPAGWPRPVGRLRVDDLAPGLAAARVVYVCGSTPFAGAVEQLLAAAGAPAEALRVERFGGEG